MENFTVFIGSPNDITGYRTATKAMLETLNAELRPYKNCQFWAFDYGDIYGGIGEPQEQINNRIKNADLMILIFGDRLGSGTIREYEVGRQLYKENRLLDLMIYLKDNDNASQNSNFKYFTEGLSNTVLYHKYKTLAEFEEKLALHLRLWVSEKNEVFNLCNAIIPDKNLLATLSVPEPFYSDAVIELKKMSFGKLQKASRNEYESYIKGNQLSLTHEKCYLIAIKLLEDIKSNNDEIFKHRQFIFPIHQYLSKLIRENEESKTQTIPILIDWLVSKDKYYHTSRDFAAFELGMCKAETALPYLLKAVGDQFEHFAVRNYAAMAVGMIKRKESLEEIISVYKKENDPSIKQSLSQSIIFILDYYKKYKI